MLLFSAFFQELSNNMPSEHGYKTIAEIHRAQWDEYTAYKEDVFGGDWYLDLNFWGFSCIWWKRLICSYKSQCVDEMLTFYQRWIPGTSMIC